MKKKKLLIGTIILVLIICIFIAALFFTTKINFSLNGKENITLLWQEEYKEDGFKALKCNFLYCKNINDKVKIENNVNTTALGEYTITYTTTYKDKKYELSRNITVTEKEAPVISLLGNKDINVCKGAPYQEEGYSAVDNYDGDINDKVIIEQKNDGIYYYVKDTANNETTEIRKITYSDNEKPILALTGGNTIYIEKGSIYKDKYSAKDNCDGDITSKVIVEGTVDTNKNGTYELKYSISDTVGNNTTATRKVIVYSLEANTPQEYEVALEKYIKDKNYKTSVIYYNIKTGYTYKYNENKIYYGASLIKTLDALYVYEKMEITPELKALVKPTIEQSNNQTHRQLVNIIGINNIRAYGKSIGTSYTLTGDNSDYFGNATANDQLAILKYLYNFVNTNPNGEELKQYFINNKGNFIKYEGLPTVMHKYGKYGNYYHDVGIVLDENPYIVIILTAEGTNKYTNIINDLSKKINNLHKLT